jgi:hypothetical protein
MTLITIDVAGGAVGAVRLGPVDDELSVAERAEAAPKDQDQKGSVFHGKSSL